MISYFLFIFKLLFRRRVSPVQVIPSWPDGSSCFEIYNILISIWNISSYSTLFLWNINHLCHHPSYPWTKFITHHLLGPMLINGSEVFIVFSRNAFYTGLFATGCRIHFVQKLNYCYVYFRNSLWKLWFLNTLEIHKAYKLKKKDLFI